MNGLQQLINQLCPNGVEWKSLGEVCEFVNGFAFKSSLFRQSGSRIIRITNIDGVNINTNDSIYFDCNDYKEDLSKYIIKEGDIAIAMSGATTGKIGRYIDNDYSYINQRVGLFKPKKCLSVSFLYHFLLSKSYDIYLLAGGGAQPNLGSNSLMTKVKIPLPPLAIQSRIVEILDHFTNLTANLTAELALRRKQFEHFREKLLALDGVEGVEMKKLGEVCEKVSKIKWGNIPQEDEFVYVDLTSVDIKSHSISTDYIITAENAPSRAQQIIKSDDILFATTRPTQMRYCIIPDNLNQQICSTGYCVIRANKNRALPRWILYLVSANEFSIFVNEHQQGAGYPSISDRVLFTFEIPLPPLAVQQSIVAKLDKFTALIQNIENELALRQKQYEYYREKLLSFPSPSL